MTDIVERLRRRRLPIDVGQFTIYEDDKECHEAADEIERLREALLEIADIVNPYEDGDVMQEIARAALKQAQPVAAREEK